MKLISTKKNYQLNPAAVDTVSDDVGQFLGRLKASKKITVETRFTVEENLLIDMDTLSKGHPIYELAAIFAAYVGFSCVDENNGAEFFSITRQQCLDMWKYTLKYYFAGKDEQYIDDIVKKAAIICYTRILRWYATKKSKDDELAQKYIEYSKNYIIENVPQVDSLYF